MSEDKGLGITRRDFAKMTAAGIAAMAVSREEMADAASKKPLKIGLLGCGGRGTGAAIQMLKGNSNVKLVAMADLFEDRLQGSINTIKDTKDDHVLKQFDVQKKNIFIGLDAYKAIMKTDIDILMQGTLPYCRPMHVEAAINAGKHVFTEKPCAVDPVGVRRFMAAAKKAEEKKLCIVTGNQRRHQKKYVDTVKKIHDGAIGDILGMRVYWCGNLPFAKKRDAKWSDLEYCIRNWYAHCWTCGDNIVEQHIHNLDIAQWVMKANPVSVFASGGRAWKTNEPEYGDLWDNFSCDYEYPNGVHVTSLSRHWDGCDEGVFEEAIGTKGRSTCCDMMDDTGTAPIDPYVQEHIDLVNSIRGVTPYINQGVSMAESTMVAIMGRMSAYTGKKITWEQAMASDLSIVPELDFKKSYPNGPIPVPGKPRELK